jgi:hypothetical protein
LRYTRIDLAGGNAGLAVGMMLTVGSWLWWLFLAAFVFCMFCTFAADARWINNG